MENINIDDINKGLLENNYVSDSEITTTVYLSLALNKPILIEGPPGVGKTELAKTVAKSLGRNFFRIQCYEGITFEQIVGEWNYQKQLLELEAIKGKSKDISTDIFQDEYFIKRPLLSAFSTEKDSVLLIDEIDKADEEVESFLLQALGEKEITVNDLGTFPLKNDLIVILTSNSQRMLLDETKDRCLFLYISYPSVEREVRIVKRKVPEADDDLITKVVELVHRIRKLNLLKKPSVRGSVDWVRSVLNLNMDSQDEALKQSIGSVVKNKSDKEKVLKEVLKD
ncbi:AAA family ATPase [Methanobrevibacter boviskoreani]|jgi:MoxR-like ATPase|uniref:AAA family ATPase n=1 Tax=Methanobrevibacter boviskoreani TaxID=1348249 RepID=UPI0023A8AF6C|nr:MoxR family ATPase [Methanobrevibacter boviskoreani]MCI6774797.1 MoxR family ATPase [Methanobrevibacter boviskoreani]MCI6930963.1 MoxR family ATPase [Methanobrevibacter boviskoreani]MDY5615072.1 MoxR family ATPase [Methanobrevibacter boviskoreani]